MKVEDFRCPRCGSRLAVNTPICCGCGRYVHWRSYVWECWLEFVIVAALIAVDGDYTDDTCARTVGAA